MASKLRVDSILPVDGAPTNGGGGIIQVVTATTSTTVSTTTTNLIDTGLSCSITPKFSTSKVLILANQQFYYNVTNANAIYFSIYMLRGSTIIHQPALPSGDPSYEIAGYFRNGGHWTLSFLDSPNSTVATTYKLQGQIYGNTGNYSGASIKYQNDAGVTNGSSYMHLLEVSA